MSFQRFGYTRPTVLYQFPALRCELVNQITSVGSPLCTRVDRTDVVHELLDEFPVLL